MSKKIDKSEWKTKNPNLFEYDSKNSAVDVFVRQDERCPFPFHEEDWYHQGFFLDDFMTILDIFIQKNNLPYHLMKNELFR